MSMEQAVKVYCPVCGQEVDPSTAPSLTYQGKTYYFKCHRCMQRFLLAPELFVGAEREPKDGNLHGRGCC
ncbi:MAG: YHS domain-containing protein [Bacillota bacterium]